MASREKINEVVVRPLQELARQIFGGCRCGHPASDHDEYGCQFNDCGRKKADPT
jgi:hypothetical protein